MSESTDGEEDNGNDCKPRKRYQCDKCLRTYSSSCNLRRHQLQHDTQFRCHCGATFATKQYLGEHKKGVHGGGFKCKLCQEHVTFITKTALIGHQNKEHGNKYQCVVCGKKFGSQSHLKEHMVRHEESVNQCQCNVCGRTFKHIRSLARHVKSDACVAKKRGPKLQDNSGKVCEHCGKIFQSQRGLRQHLQLHETDAQHKCESCGHTFNFFQSYVRHCKNKSCENKRGRKTRNQKNKVYWGQVGNAEMKNDHIVFVEVEDKRDTKTLNSQDDGNESDASMNYFDISYLPNLKKEFSEMNTIDNKGSKHEKECYVIGVTQDADGKIVATSTSKANIGDLYGPSGNFKSLAVVSDVEKCCYVKLDGKMEDSVMRQAMNKDLTMNGLIGKSQFNCMNQDSNTDVVPDKSRYNSQSQLETANTVRRDLLGEAMKEVFVPIPIIQISVQTNEDKSSIVVTDTDESSSVLTNTDKSSLVLTDNDKSSLVLTDTDKSSNVVTDNDKSSNVAKEVIQHYNSAVHQALSGIHIGQFKQILDCQEILLCKVNKEGSSNSSEIHQETSASRENGQEA